MTVSKLEPTPTKGKPMFSKTEMEMLEVYIAANGFDEHVQKVIDERLAEKCAQS